MNRQREGPRGRQIVTVIRTDGGHVIEMEGTEEEPMVTDRRPEGTGGTEVRVVRIVTEKELEKTIEGTMSEVQLTMKRIVRGKRKSSKDREDSESGRGESFRGDGGRSTETQGTETKTPGFLDRVQGV